MRVLVTTWDGGGNVPPMVALTEQLLRAGHTIHVLGHETALSSFPTGCSSAAFTRAPNFVRSREVGSTAAEPRTPLGAFASMRDRLMVGPADRFAADALEQIERFRPDLLLVDFMLIGGFVAAEAAGVPAVSLMHTIYALPVAGAPPLGLGLLPARTSLGRRRDAALRLAFRKLWGRSLPALNRAREQLGLTPARDVFDQLAAVEHTLVTTSPAFDFTAPFVPAGVSYIGLQRPEAPSPPPVVDRRSEPLVVASYSTTDQDQEARLERVAAALGRLPVRGLVTTGPVVRPKSRHDNVEMHPYVDHRLVLPQAAALVTHGGHGSVLAALTAGVPVVCVPQGRDQADVAARVRALGAGVVVPAWSSPARLARAIGRVVDDPLLRDRARAARDAIATSPIACPVKILEGLRVDRPYEPRSGPPRSAAGSSPRARRSG